MSSETSDSFGVAKIREGGIFLRGLHETAEATVSSCFLETERVIKTLPFDVLIDSMGAAMKCICEEIESHEKV